MLPAGVRIVDSAATTAAALSRELETRGGNATGADRGRLEWLATDDAQRFARVGSRFFGEALRAEAVEIIDLSGGNPRAPAERTLYIAQGTHVLPSGDRT